MTLAVAEAFVVIRGGAPTWRTTVRVMVPPAVYAEPSALVSARVMLASSLFCIERVPVAMHVEV